MSYRYRPYQYRGVRNNAPVAAKPRHKTPVNVNPADASTISSWLVAYSGNFQYLKDMQAELAKQGLTDAQWGGVVKCYNNDRQRTAAVVSIPDARLITPIPVVVSRSAALRIKENLGLMFAPFTLEVVGVQSSTFNGFKAQSMYDPKIPYIRNLDLVVRINASNAVNVCRICGKSLTDHKSVVSGIGPVCAKSLGAIYHTYQNDIQKFMKQFADECNRIGEFTVSWKPFHVKEGYSKISLELLDIHNQFKGNTIPISAPIVVQPPIAVSIPTSTPTVDYKLSYDPSTKWIVVKDNVQKEYPLEFTIEESKFIKSIQPAFHELPIEFILENVRTQKRVLFKKIAEHTYTGVNFDNRKINLFITL